MAVLSTRTTILTILIGLLFFSACNEGGSPETRSDRGVVQLTGEPVEFEPGSAVTRQTVYVPVYSHIYQRRQDRVVDLTITLSIRNTDRVHGIVLTSVAYYDDHGKLLREYVETPLRLQALGTSEVVVEAADRSGGSGANFIVEWAATKAVSPPVVEAVMISTSGQQGLSFTSRGVTIESRP